MRKLNNGWTRTAHLAIFSTLVLTLLGGSGIATAAGSAEAKLSVTATILKRASLKMLAQPASVVITAADIARGYVDVPAAAQVAIRSNTRTGFMLEFASQGDFMSQILVSGLGSDVQLSPAGGIVTQSSAATGVTQKILALGFRFRLAESAQEGVYPWPMRVSIAPL
jgi:hypothetical protein